MNSSERLPDWALDMNFKFHFVLFALKVMFLMGEIDFYICTKHLLLGKNKVSHEKCVKLTAIFPNLEIHKK